MGMFPIKKHLTIKNVTSVATLGVSNALRKSKDARKAFLVGGAAVGAFYAAPYIAAGAAKLGTAATIGGGKLISLLGPAAPQQAPDQISDQASSIESMPSSPSQMDFYGYAPQNPNMSKAAFAVPATTAASMSSCGSTMLPSSSTVPWLDFLAPASLIVGLALASFWIGLSIVRNHQRKKYRQGIIR